jgi:hypothetical protein
MTDSVSLEKMSADGLQCVRWVFQRDRNELYVARYEELTRDSKRKKFQGVRQWLRLYKRDSTMKYEEVPLTPEIEAEALEALVRKIRDEVHITHPKDWALEPARPRPRQNVT